MADTPQKDKRANAIERIKALREGRAAGKRGDSSVETPKATKDPKRSHSNTGHRPQGG
jgi:hypothetical protein